MSKQLSIKYTNWSQEYFRKIIASPIIQPNKITPEQKLNRPLKLERKITS
ncbi:MAG: hypothetical protein ACHQT9_00140 [Candidatus Saccharimonadales bacterium]